MDISAAQWAQGLGKTLLKTSETITDQLPLCCYTVECFWFRETDPR